MAKKKLAQSKAIKKAVKKATSTEPLWKGPEVDGITQSMLGRFLSCRERFRVYAIEGYAPHDTFNSRIHFGNMWHQCEETYAKGGNWKSALSDLCRQYGKEYPMQQGEIVRWFGVCRMQFPIYLEYWKRNDDVKQRENIIAEESFAVPYKLSSGRTVLLRGKWDSIDYIGKNKIYLQENKTKGDIKEDRIAQQLSFDMQTMMYLVAMKYWNNGINAKHICGVRYNVVRRPLSGGRHSIRQHKPTKSNPSGESLQDFMQRLEQCICSEPEYFFMRWKVEISAEEIQKFEEQFLQPILHQLVDWYDWMVSPLGSIWCRSNSRHFRYPYGVYNPTLEGNVSEYDNYLDTGSITGLTRIDSLFTELA